MAIINFAIPATLERRVKKKMQTDGYSSKAEFFRMATMRMIQEDVDDSEQIKMLVSAISDEVRIKFKGKRIPSVESQLKGL